MKARKIVNCLLLVVLTATCCIVSSSKVSAAYVEVQIGNTAAYSDGYDLQLDAAPYLRNGRAMVPLRFIAEAFGASVSAANTQSGVEAEIQYRNVDIYLLVGDPAAHYINEYGYDTVQPMDVAPEIRNGRMFVPLRFIAEGLGAAVYWDPDSQVITIDQY